MLMMMLFLGWCFFLRFWGKPILFLKVVLFFFSFFLLAMFDSCFSVYLICKKTINLDMAVEILGSLIIVFWLNRLQDGLNFCESFNCYCYWLVICFVCFYFWENSALRFFTWLLCFLGCFLVLFEMLSSIKGSLWDYCKSVTVKGRVVYNSFTHPPPTVHCYVIWQMTYSKFIHLLFAE